MRRLYLLRHADAASHRSHETDHDRPLTSTGHASARRLGTFLRRTDQIPDRVLSSDAVRALETAESVRKTWEADVPLRTSEMLYQCEPRDVLDEIRLTSETAPSLLVVGHQPTWAATIRKLAGDAQVRLPTGTCVCLKLPSQPWADVKFGHAEIEWMLPPRLLT